MNFLNYVKQRCVTDTPFGDFTADARTDRSFPDARTWREVETYLRHRDACPEAVTAARVVWRAYLLGAYAERRETDSWEKPIRDFLVATPDGIECRLWDVFASALGMVTERAEKKDEIRAAAIMKKLGWVKRRTNVANLWRRGPEAEPYDATHAVVWKADRGETDPWVNLIRDFLAATPDDTGYRLKDVFASALRMAPERVSEGEKIRAAAIMKKLGWVKWNSHGVNVWRRGPEAEPYDALHALIWKADR